MRSRKRGETRTQFTLDIDIHGKETAQSIVELAVVMGATAAEAVVRQNYEFSTVVRMGKVETLKQSGSRAVGIRVFEGDKSASTYCSILQKGLRRAVQTAIELSRSLRSEDRIQGFRIHRNSAALVGISVSIIRTYFHYLCGIVLISLAAPRSLLSILIPGLRTRKAERSKWQQITGLWPIPWAL